jgi:hypothetical protein
MGIKKRIRFFIILCIIICSIYIVYSISNPGIEEAYSEKKSAHFHCGFHYGDNIVNLKFFYAISKKLKENNIMIQYYYDNNQNKNANEFKRYIDDETVSLRLISEVPPESIELWMGRDIDGVGHVDFDVYFPKFYTRILTALNLQDQGIDVSLYQKEDYLLDIYTRLDDKYKDLDILILNSQPHSGQFATYNVDSMNALCRRLATKYKIATSTYVDDSIPCTFTDGLAIQDIGAISTHAKAIVAVFSGPITACFNQYTKEHVKKWILLLSHPIKFAEINVVLVDNVDAVDSVIGEP